MSMLSPNDEDRSKRSSNRASELSSNRASELSSNRASELSSNRTSELSSNRASELSSNRTSDRSSNRTSHQPANRFMNRSAGSPAVKIAYGAVFTALALVFSYIEFLLPGVGIPGVKLGLANLIILIVLYTLGTGAAYIVNISRIVLAGLMFTGLFALVYALVGGMISLTVMCLLKKSGLFSMIGVSTGAAVAHNFGQVLVASLIIEDVRMFVYFPVLVFSGIISGILVGLLAYLILKRLGRSTGSAAKTE